MKKKRFHSYQNKEKIINIYDEKIKDLKNDNDQLTTYLKQEEKKN